MFSLHHPTRCTNLPTQVSVAVNFSCFLPLRPFFPPKESSSTSLKRKKRKLEQKPLCSMIAVKEWKKGNEGECQSFSFTSILVDCARLSAMKNTEKKRTEAEKKWNIYSAIKAGIWRIMKLLPLLQTAGGGDGTHIFLIFIMMLCWWEICDA